MLEMYFWWGGYEEAFVENRNKVHLDLYDAVVWMAVYEKGNQYIDLKFVYCVVCELYLMFRI